MTETKLKQQAVSTSFITSGTYTPSLYNGTNVAASGLNADFMYIRIGNIVIVSGSITIDPTATGTTELGISLPIASNLGTSYDLNGNGTNPGATDQILSIIADTTNDRAACSANAKSTANAFWRIVFMYRII